PSPRALVPWSRIMFETLRIPRYAGRESTSRCRRKYSWRQRMHKQKIFPLRIPAEERRRAQRLALRMGLSENRLYSDLIHDGLILREQMAYIERLRALRVSPREGLAILNRAPNVPPASEDRRPRSGS